MKKAFIIDIDHMGFKTTEDVLKIAEKQNYPLIAGHTNFLEQMFDRKSVSETECGWVKLKNEHAKDENTLQMIKKLGGIICPITEGDKDVKTFVNGIVKNDNPGSSKTWAQTYLFALSKNGNKNVGLGTDFNGFATELCPRFGTYSAYSLRDDKIRENQIGDRDTLEKLQKNGVKYESPLQDTRGHKFTNKGTYLNDQVKMLQAIYTGYSSVNIDEIELQSRYKSIAKGIRDAVDSVPISRFEYSDNIGRPDVYKVAAYVLENKKLGVDIELTRFRNISRSDLKSFINQVNEGYVNYDRTIGDNYPMKRFEIKTNKGIRDFDYNIDGLAHYGMLPDFIQDLKNIGLNEEYLTPLFNSTADFMLMWEKCETQSKAIR